MLRISILKLKDWLCLGRQSTWYFFDYNGISRGIKIGTGHFDNVDAI
jgi:hypothetical protein